MVWLTCHWQGCLKSRPSPDALPTASLVPRPICTPFFLSAREISAARSMTDRMLLQLCLPRGSVRLISPQVTPPSVCLCSAGLPQHKLVRWASVVLGWGCGLTLSLKWLSAEGHGLHPASVFRAYFPKAHCLTPLPESMSSSPAGAFFFSNLIL